MKERISDPIEFLIASALDERGFVFVHESEDNVATKGLDFLIPALVTSAQRPAVDLYIEVKQMHSPRVAEQMARAENVIAIQGLDAALAFATMIRTRRT